MASSLVQQRCSSRINLSGLKKEYKNTGKKSFISQNSTSELTGSLIEQPSPSLFKKKKREELYYTHTKIKLENLAERAMEPGDDAMKY